MVHRLLSIQKAIDELNEQYKTFGTTMSNYPYSKCLGDRVLTYGEMLKKPKRKG